MSSYSITRQRTRDNDHPFFLLQSIGLTGKSYRDGKMFGQQPHSVRGIGQFELNINQGGIQNRYYGYSRGDIDRFAVEVLPVLAEKYPGLLERFPDLLKFTGRLTLHFHEGVLQKAEFHDKG